MIAVGTAFFYKNHAFFVISDPAANSGDVLCVNLTTCDEECVDDECLLDHIDYAWIEVGHRTAVAFSRAQIFKAANIDQCLQSGLLKAVNPPVVPAATVAKVVAIAKTARELSRNKKAML